MRGAAGGGVVWGAAAEPRDLDAPDVAGALARDFSGFTPEDHLKFGPTQPEPGRFDLAAAERLVRAARVNRQRLRGHVMFWYAQNPPWLERVVVDRASGLRAMRSHVRALFERFVAYRDVITQWDVVNEAFEPDGSLRRTVWQRAIGDDYVEQAFRIAGEELARVNRRIPGRRDDWRLALFYNDFVDDTFVAFDALFDVSGRPDPTGRPGSGVPAGSGDCAGNPKCAAIQALVRGLVARRAPIDGVGFQAHIASAAAPDYDALTDWVGALGLRWAVTELDNPCPRGDAPGGGTTCASTTQRAVFDGIMRACLSDPACDHVVQWGISDRESWWDRLGQGAFRDPLALGRDLLPKPAGEAVRAALLEAAGAPRPPQPRLTVARGRRGLLHLRVVGLPRAGVREVAFTVGRRTAAVDRRAGWSATVRLTPAERRARRLRVGADVVGGFQARFLERLLRQPGG